MMIVICVYVRIGFGFLGARGASQDSAHSSSALYAMYDAMAPQTKNGAFPIPTSPAFTSPAFNAAAAMTAYA